MRYKTPVAKLFYLFLLSPLVHAQLPASVIGAGYKTPAPIPVAPGQVITFFVHGIGAGMTQPQRAQGYPLPTSIGGIAATLEQFDPALPVPIFAVEPISPCAGSAQPACGTYLAITVQIPFAIKAEDPTNPRGVPAARTQLLFSERGAAAARIDLIPLVDQVHLVRTCDLLFDRREGSCGSVVTHADGSPVTAERPAHGGEEVVLYAVGLGATTPSLPAGRPATQPLPVSLPFTVSFDPRQNALASRPQSGDPLVTPVFAGLTPDYVGLYQLNVTVPDLPPGALPCYPASRVRGSQIMSNMTVNIGGPSSFDGAGICVEPAGVDR